MELNEYLVCLFPRQFLLVQGDKDVAFARANMNKDLITNLCVCTNSSLLFRYTTPLLLIVLIHV